MGEAWSFKMVAPENQKQSSHAYLGLLLGLRFGGFFDFFGGGCLFVLYFEAGFPCVACTVLEPDL